MPGGFQYFWWVSMANWSPPGKPYPASVLWPARQVLCCKKGEIKIWKSAYTRESPRQTLTVKCFVAGPASVVLQKKAKHLPGRAENTCPVGFAGRTPICHRGPPNFLNAKPDAKSDARKRTSAVFKHFSRICFSTFCKTTLAGCATKHLPGTVCRGESNSS